MQPIPVSAARKIGQDYKKDMVIIVSYSQEDSTVATATWGRGTTDKETIVTVRDACMRALLDQQESTTHQDYRFIKEGERAKIVDDLVQACQQADTVIGQILDTCRSNEKSILPLPIADLLESRHELAKAIAKA